MKLENLKRLGEDIGNTLDSSYADGMNLSFLPGVETVEDLREARKYLTEQGYIVELSVNASFNDSFNYAFKLKSYSFSIRRKNNA
jgi:hypothetical protein